MLKLHSRKIEIFHKFFDVFIIAFSWGLAYYYRFEGTNAEQGLIGWYIKVGLFITLLSYYNFRRNSLYTSKRFDSISNEVLTLLRVHAVTILTFILVLYLFSAHKVSRLHLIYYSLISSVLLVSVKISVRLFLHNLRRTGRNTRYALVFGNSANVEHFVEKILKQREYGIVIRGWLDSNGLAEKYGCKLIDQFNENILSDLSPDLVIMGYKASESSKSDPILKELSKTFVEILFLPDMSHSLVGYSIYDFQGTPVIKINEPDLRSSEIIFKRSLDLVLSTVALIVLSPFFLLIGLIIKLTSKGPIFYYQERMGLDGQVFKMYKFRSMVSDSRNNQGWTVKNDPRVTRIGSVLRKSSLDELPQLWNVFCGDMSLVGPRPERPMFVEEFKSKIPAYMLRHKMKAGMTGWAQINGWRGDTSIEKRIECDLYYIRHWSIWMDVSIIFMTIWKGFFNRNAY